MPPVDLVLVDTCVWVPYFNRPRSEEKRRIDELLDDDRAVLIGPILAEILQGFRRDDEADWVSSRLRGVRFLELTWNDWRDAAQLGRSVAAAGLRIPLTDLVVAAVAIQRGLSIYSTDPHFDRFEHVRRFGR